MNILKIIQTLKKENIIQFVDENFNSDMMEIFLCIFKLIIYLKILFSLNYFVGLFLIVIYNKVYEFILYRFFRLRKLCTNDLFMLGFSRSERNNMICCFFFEKFFNPIAIRNLLINKGIKMNNKLRQKIVRKCGIFFWEEVDLQTAENSVKIIDNIYSSKDDVVNYVRKEIDNHIDIVKCLPYEFQIISYKNKQGGAILFKVDHTLSDGLGMVSFTLTLSDNFHESVMPEVLKKMKIPFHRELAAFFINLLFFPYYSAKLLLNGFINKIEESPFKRPFKSSGLTSFSFTKNYDFQSLHQINKKLNITFNDLMLAVISSSFNKYSQKNHSDKKYTYKKLNVAIPIGVKDVPKSTSEVQIQNDILGAITILERIDDPLTQYEMISKKTKYTIKNHYNTSASRYLFTFFNEFLPYSYHKKVAEKVGDTVDMAISNLPGPTGQVFYCGSKVEDILPFNSLGIGKAFIIIGTYNNMVRIVTCVDPLLNINVDMLSNIIDEEINRLIKTAKI
jgi:hypothetical protein